MRALLHRKSLLSCVAEQLRTADNICLPATGTAVLCYAVLLLRVNFRNLTVVYAEETARFAATMPWLYVAAGYPVGTGGKAIDDPEAAGDQNDVDVK